VLAFADVEAFDTALRVIQSLNEARVDYVVVGGVAVNLHGLIRATEDLDADALRAAFGLDDEEP
jgi:hypothetical protein